MLTPRLWGITSILCWCICTQPGCRRRVGTQISASLSASGGPPIPLIIPTHSNLQHIMHAPIELGVQNLCPHGGQGGLDGGYSSKLNILAWYKTNRAFIYRLRSHQDHCSTVNWALGFIWLQTFNYGCHCNSAGYAFVPGVRLWDRVGAGVCLRGRNDRDDMGFEKVRIVTIY